MITALNLRWLLAALLAMSLLCCVSAQPAVTRAAEESTIELTFTPSSIPESTLSGRLIDTRTQEILAGVQIELADHDRGLFLGAITDAEGRFTFKNLAFGGYHLAISVPNYMRVSQHFQITEHVRISADVRLFFLGCASR
jgi:hypothetical protein